MAAKSLLLLGGLLLLAAVVAIAELYSQIPRYKKYWQSHNQKTAPANALVYVALGDSTAQGIGATSPERGYVGLLAASLAKKHDRPVKVVNLSKTGAKLQDCLKEQLPQLKNLKPDVVTIEIGANDIARFDNERFKEEFAQIIKALPKGTYISDMPYFGGGRRSASEKSAKEANKIIYELAKSQDVIVAPLHRETEQRDHFINYAIDFFHPSNAGYKNWHAAFWQVMEH